MKAFIDHTCYRHDCAVCRERHLCAVVRRRDGTVIRVCEGCYHDGFWRTRRPAQLELGGVT